MNKIKIEKEIETEGLNIVQLKERIETLVAELEAEGFDPKESSLYIYEWKDTLELTCYRDETPEEEAKRVSEEEEAQRAADEARAAAIKQKRLRELETENARLKKLLAESLLENEVTREALRKKW